MISKRLPDISGHKKYFDKVAAISNEVLKNSVCNETFKFSPTIPTTRHRGKNIIWFNLPPFSSNVKTNAGKLFLTLLEKYFLQHYKLFDNYNVKITYSVMSNMKSVIQSHNANLISKHFVLLQHAHAVPIKTQNFC